jgi:hypothetical protein
LPLAVSFRSIRSWDFLFNNKFWVLCETLKNVKMIRSSHKKSR